MSQQDRPTLKTYFETGDFPTQAQIVNLIDSHALVSEVDLKASIASPVFTGVTTANESLVVGTTITLAGVLLTPTAAELNHVDGVTSPIQTQLNALAPSATQAWAGVRYALLGTSISSQTNSFVSILDSMLGSTAQNLGASGQTISPAASGQIFLNVPKVKPDRQLVIFDGLVNDFRGATAIGTTADTDPSTLHGALYSAVTSLIAADPLRQVVLCTPYGFTYSTPNWLVANGNGVTFGAYCQAIRDAASRLGVPLCDIATLSGIGGPTAGVFMPTDGIHIDNVTGATRYAKTLYEFLRNVPRGTTVRPVLPSGWTLVDAVIGDISGTRTTPIAITSGLLTYSKLADYGVLWCGGAGQNAIQFDCASGQNPNAHIAVCDGVSGWGAYGVYDAASITFRGAASDGNITIGTLTATTGPALTVATRFRVSILNGIVRQESWNGSAWILELQYALDSQAIYTFGHREKPRLGLVVNSSSVVPFSNIKVGTYA